ncbi:ABC transporter permease [Paenibacillus sp. ACRRX]|uniref:methionine ABC transporter permease n=1 Tax=Paenibacillus sp. ACRRX TaxID=2918206 RepID=UPI001EF4BF3C|nr:methionine ABC transporter permease [Paenibacillus sp. ACRRX]MCG7410480.1 ABC transporter permease [Paenibacillus sp. ACRRX]
MVFGIDFSEVNWSEVSQASADTLNMLGFSVLFTFIIGLPLGVLLFLSGKSSHWFVKVMYSLLSLMVNVLRSVPFVILMIAILPFTKVLIGTTIGVKGAIPALVIAAAPFFARLVETSLREVDRGVIEAAQAMGASTWQIVRKVLLPEAMPGLIAGTTITAVTLISYTAMSGLVGGGGLGDLAIRYGYQRYETSVMIIAIAVMIIMVQILQWIGDRFVRHYTRK